MPGPDLSFGRRQVEELMVDACVITRNPGGVATDSIDYETGQLSAEQPLVVYSQLTTGIGGRALAHESELGGIFKIAPVEGTQMQHGDLDDATIKKHRGSIPIDAPLIKQWDFVEVKFATHDPHLVGKKYQVVHVYGSTFAVSQRFLLEERAYERR